MHTQIETYKFTSKNHVFVQIFTNKQKKCFILIDCD